MRRSAAWDAHPVERHLRGAQAGIGIMLSVIALAAFVVVFLGPVPVLLFLALRRQQREDLARHLVDRPAR